MIKMVPEATRMEQGNTEGLVINGHRKSYFARKFNLK